MMAVDLLHVAVHLAAPSRVSFWCSSPCRRPCNAGAYAPHFALPPVQPSTVQASCFERTRPAAVAAFAGALAACAAAPPGRRCPEQKRRAKAEGKIKGRGTWPLESPVCTWGECGTSRGAAACREGTQRRIGIGEVACCARWTAPVLDRATP